MGRKLTTKKEIETRLEGRNIKLVSEEYKIAGEVLEWECLVDGCGHSWNNTVSEVLNNRSNCIMCARKGMQKLSLLDMHAILLKKGGRFKLLSTEERKSTNALLLFYDHKNNKELHQTWENLYKLTTPAKYCPEYAKEYHSRPEVKERNRKRAQTEEGKKKAKGYRESEQGRRTTKAYNNSPKGKMNRKLRKFCKRIRRHLQNQEDFHTKDIIYDNGYSWEDYIKQFNKGLYTWKDYNKDSNKYHIDHIIPLSYFRDIILTLSEKKHKNEIKRLMQLCNCPTNMRIWPKKENHEKYCFIDYSLVVEHNLEEILKEVETLKIIGNVGEIICKK